MLSIRKTHDLTHTWIASSFETLFAQIKTLRWRAVAGPAAAGPYSSYLSYLSHHLRTLFIRYILFLSFSLSFFFDSHPRIFSYYILATRLFYLSNSRAQSYFIFLYVSSFFLHIDFIDPGVRVWSNSIELAPFLEDLRVVLCFKGGNSPCKSIQMIGVYFNSPLKNVVHKKKKKKKLLWHNANTNKLADSVRLKAQNSRQSKYARKFCAENREWKPIHEYSKKKPMR